MSIFRKDTEAVAGYGATREEALQDAKSRLPYRNERAYDRYDVLNGGVMTDPSGGSKEFCMEIRYSLRRGVPYRPAQEGSMQERFSYIVMPRNRTYAEGVHALREACEEDLYSAQPTFRRSDGSVIYRPLTFRENIEARVTDYNTLNNSDGTPRSDEERKRLFVPCWWNRSCTGIAYKANTTKFKIIHQCEQLINIDGNFNSAFLPVDYDSLQGIELDTGRGIYRSRLTKQGVLGHDGWLAVLEGDKVLLKEYADIIFSLRRGKLMSFWTRIGVTTGELRALRVCSLDVNSDAVGDGGLDDDGRFVRVQRSAEALRAPGTGGH